MEMFSTIVFFGVKKLVNIYSFKYVATSVCDIVQK